MPEPDQTTSHEVELFGWDTAFGVRLSELNEKLAKTKLMPQGFSIQLPEDRVTAEGHFAVWSVVRGGDCQIVQLTTKIPEAVVSGPGIDNHPLSGKLVVELRLAYFDGEVPSCGALMVSQIIMANSSPIQIVSLTVDGLHQLDMAVIALKACLQKYLNQNLPQFQHVFAHVDINRTAANGRFNWLQPTAKSYAYVDSFDGDGILGVLCMTGNRDPANLASQISPWLVPEGASATLGISKARFIEQLLLPCLPGMFRGTSMEDFVVNPIDGSIGLARGAAPFEAYDQKSGIPHACKLMELCIKVEGTNVLFTASTSYDEQLGLHATSNIVATLGVDEQSASGVGQIGFVVKNSQVAQHTEQDEAVTVVEAVLAVASLVLSLLVIILSDGTLILLAALVAGLCGVAAGAIQLYENDGKQRAQGDADQLAKAALDATGAIAWSDEKDFRLDTVSINGSLQLSGTLSAPPA